MVSVLSQTCTTNYVQWRSNRVGRMGKVQGPPSVGGRVPGKNIPYNDEYKTVNNQTLECFIATPQLRFKIKSYLTRKHLSMSVEYIVNIEKVTNETLICVLVSFCNESN